MIRNLVTLTCVTWSTTRNTRILWSFCILIKPDSCARHIRHIFWWWHFWFTRNWFLILILNFASLWIEFWLYINYKFVFCNRNELVCNTDYFFCTVFWENIWGFFISHDFLKAWKISPNLPYVICIFWHDFFCTIVSGMYSKVSYKKRVAYTLNVLINQKTN